MVSECRHDGVRGLDKITRCKHCGEVLTKQIIAKVQSSYRAKRILDEIAVAGEYVAAGFNGEFVIYSKKRNGVIEEITIEEYSDKQFQIVKSIKE